MKNCFFLFFFLLFAANTATAQVGNQAYWKREAQKIIGKADRVINYYNKQTKVFSPAELRMMKTSPHRFTQLANTRTRRYSNVKRQYERMYNRDWVNSFGAMGPKRPVVRLRVIRPQVVRRPVVRYRRY